MDPVFEQRRERLDEFEADAGVPAGERHHFHQDHEAHDRVPEVLAHPRGVRTDDVLLELPEFGSPIRTWTRCPQPVLTP